MLSYPLNVCSLSLLVVTPTAALEALQALGWVVDEEHPQELVVREGLYFTMKEVRTVVLYCLLVTQHLLSVAFSIGDTAPTTKQ